MRTAVIGHVEWVQFALVERTPVAGEIVAAIDHWEHVGGGAAISAVQLARLAGSTAFFTALGEDELGTRSREQLQGRGLEVQATGRAEPTRRAFSHLDRAGERTITVLGGPKLAPCGSDPLPWHLIEGADAALFLSGDPGAVRRARAARLLTASPRELPVLAAAGVQVDVLIGSGQDETERYRPGDIAPPPRLVVETLGSRGGRWTEAGGRTGGWDPAPIPGPTVDSFGCGDAFAAALTYALGARLPLPEALAFAARAGASVLTRRGPYDGQLTGADAAGPA